MSNPIAQTLQDARRRLRSAEQFVSGEPALDARGNPVDPRDPEAVRWSTFGAIRAVAPSAEVAERVQRLVAEVASRTYRAEVWQIEEQGGHMAVSGLLTAAVSAATADGQDAPPAAARRQAAPPRAAKTSPRPAPAADVQLPAPRDPQHTTSVGLYRNVRELTEAIAAHHERYNVCLPVMQPDVIPALNAIALRAVAIDTRVRGPYNDPVGGDIYKREGKYALTAIGLHKLIVARGMSLHPGFSGRVDDGSDPYFRAYRACGFVRGLDGTPRLITRTYALDLRDGSPRVKQILARAEKYNASDRGRDRPRDPWDEIDQMRTHIDARCETGAVNRVARAEFFIKGQYTLEELQRPFMVAALVFTGETEDPELRREVARAMVQLSTGMSDMLFGAGPSAPARELQDLVSQARIAPPPVGIERSNEDPDDDDGDEDGAGAR